MQKTVNIIGGGMAGLCAGSYLQMNGYKVTVFEMNSTPGGVCTSWLRGNYTVDLCIHWLVGSGSGSSFYDRWNELINLEEIKFNCLSALGEWFFRGYYVVERHWSCYHCLLNHPIE